MLLTGNMRSHSPYIMPTLALYLMSRVVVLEHVLCWTPTAIHSNSYSHPTHTNPLPYVECLTGHVPRVGGLYDSVRWPPHIAIFLSLKYTPPMDATSRASDPDLDDASWYVIYMSEKMATLKDENRQLRARVEELEDEVANRTYVW